jgi:curved DNA-binding protein
VLTAKYALQQLLGFSKEILQFHLWYLRSKRFVAYTPEGSLAITVFGVDHVIAMSKVHAQEQLRIEQARYFGGDAELS